MEQQQSIKSILESPTYEHQKLLLSREINKPRVEVNFKEFKKTGEEKNQLLNLKMQWEQTKPEKPKLIGRYEF